MQVFCNILNVKKIVPIFHLGVCLLGNIFWTGNVWCFRMFFLVFSSADEGTGLHIISKMLTNVHFVCIVCTGYVRTVCSVHGCTVVWGLTIAVSSLLVRYKPFEHTTQTARVWSTLVSLTQVLHGLRVRYFISFLHMLSRIIFEWTKIKQC